MGLWLDRVRTSSAIAASLKQAETCLLSACEGARSLPRVIAETLEIGLVRALRRRLLDVARELPKQQAVLL